MVTDERPASLDAALFLNPFAILELQNCTLSPQLSSQLTDSFYKVNLDLFTGRSHNGEGASVMHVIGGVCGSSCGADIAHGYLEVAQALGGTSADICQDDLGASLQAMIDSISGLSSPAVLEYVPISASLQVALGAQELPRSRQRGFDYSSTSNSVVFINVPIQKGDQVVAAYRRWEKQEQIQ